MHPILRLITHRRAMKYWISDPFCLRPCLRLITSHRSSPRRFQLFQLIFLTFTPRFNPIAATFMRKAIVSIVSSHLSLPTSSTSKSRATGLPKEAINALVEAANGDIRSAIMGVQFACTAMSKAGEAGSNGNVNGRRAKRGKISTKSERDAALKTM